MKKKKNNKLGKSNRVWEFLSVCYTNYVWATVLLEQVWCDADDSSDAGND